MIVLKLKFYADTPLAGTGITTFLQVKVQLSNIINVSTNNQKSEIISLIEEERASWVNGGELKRLIWLIF